MMRFVVSPSFDASTARPSPSGRRAMLKDADPLAWRWVISSAIGSETLTMYDVPALARMRTFWYVSFVDLSV